MSSLVCSSYCTITSLYLSGREGGFERRGGGGGVRAVRVVTRARRRRRRGLVGLVTRSSSPESISFSRRRSSTRTKAQTASRPRRRKCSSATSSRPSRKRFDQDTVCAEPPTRTDFKPGTNAQRHRRHSSEETLSSKTTDLTGMVQRLRTGISFMCQQSQSSGSRHVNVTSSGESSSEPAASPAPDQQHPTADRRLSWRSSAPDYGTF